MPPTSVPDFALAVALTTEVQQAAPSQQSHASPALVSQRQDSQWQSVPQQSQSDLAFAFAVRAFFSAGSDLADSRFDVVFDAGQHSASPQQSHGWPGVAVASQVQAAQAQSPSQHAQAVFAPRVASATARAERFVKAARANAATVPINPRRFIIALLFLFAS